MNTIHIKPQKIYAHKYFSDMQEETLRDEQLEYCRNMCLSYTIYDIETFKSMYHPEDILLAHKFVNTQLNEILKTKKMYDISPVYTPFINLVHIENVMVAYNEVEPLDKQMHLTHDLIVFANTLHKDLEYCKVILDHIVYKRRDDDN